MQADNNIAKLRNLIQAAQSKAKGSLIQLVISRVQIVRDENLSMRYCLTQSLAKKINHTQANVGHKVDPFLNPDPALVITKLGDSHLLLFNKFNIFRNHLLVVTQKFESQKEKLNLDDILKGTEVFLALKGILFFNGGELSGASQPVKHLQVLPEEATELPIFDAIKKFVEKKINEQQNLVESKIIMKFPGFNFKHGIIAINKSSDSLILGKQLFQSYDQLYKNLVMHTINGKQQRRDYNMIACDSFIAIFIRKQEKAFKELSVNSVGYLGSVLFKDAKLLEQFLDNKVISPTSILSEISMDDQL